MQQRGIIQERIRNVQSVLVPGAINHGGDAGGSRGDAGLIMSLKYGTLAKNAGRFILCQQPSWEGGSRPHTALKLQGSIDF